MKKKERNRGKKGGKEGWARRKQARQEKLYYLTIILRSYMRAELISTIAAPSSTLNCTTLDRYPAFYKSASSTESTTYKSK